MSKSPTPSPPPTGLVFNPANHRYRLDGKAIRGVTGLIGGGVPKPFLIPWAGRMAGQWLIDHREEAFEMPDDELVKAAGRAHAVVRDAAAFQGSAVHARAESIHRGEEQPTFTDDLTPFVEGYQAFLDAWKITPLLVERPCASRAEWYAGTFDLIATSPYLADGAPVQIDIKTSRSVHGETKLQTAAYARAEFYVDDKGDEQPMPDLAACYVAHCTPTTREGEHARYGDAPLGTSLYTMQADRDEIDLHYSWFQVAAYTAKTTAQRDRIAAPLTLPTINTKAA